MVRSLNILKVLALFSCVGQTQARINVRPESLDLLSLAFEELMDVRIVSASGKDESLFEAPVNSFVITRKNIVSSFLRYSSIDALFNLQK